MKAKLLFTAFLTFNFGLWTLNTSAQFSFVHISDLHVSNIASTVNTCDLHGVKAQCYLKEFAQINPKPAFVLATGDIANVGNSSQTMYSVFTQFLFPPAVVNPSPGAYFIDSAQTIPIYFTPGNHDYYTTLFPPGSLTQSSHAGKYSQSIAPDTDYAVTTDISVILFMRSGYDIPYWTENPLHPAGSGFTSAQCSWIRNQLSSNSSKRKIIVMHHPPVNLAGFSCDGTQSHTFLDTAAGSFINNRTAFLNICDSNHVDVVLAGHVHQNTVTNRAGDTIDENCITCGTRYIQTGAAFNGCYRIITIDSAFITVGYPMKSCALASVDELSNSLNVSVFPNPSSGEFTLAMSQFKNVQMKIYNVMGECIHQRIVTSSDFQIDLSSQPDGVYFMHLQTEQGEVVKKIFVSR